MLHRSMSKQETKSAAVSSEGLRPLGLTIAAFFYAASGVYYLTYPILLSDPTLWHLYIAGALSLVGAFGVFRMKRWGLWIGLGLFLPQLVLSIWPLMVVLAQPGVFQQLTPIALIVSLFVLMFFACLTFLLILDKRRSFK